ncbi:MAG TPA: hypothetical protein PLK37_02340 [Terricaulis sp.]|nr:hypothetical protein [Terricaulis sp.]
MRTLIAASSLLALAACSTNPFEPPPPDLPLTGPIAYSCADGTQLMVDYQGDEARVAIIGGPSMVLPQAGDNYYSNGRYGVRGAGAQAQWEVGRAGPVNCRGG